jgi:uncharacterized protein YndB with AHSA1/START domain
MAPENNSATGPADRVLTLTRTFDAPPSLVFKAWTVPEHVMGWWGPHGFKVISCKMDLAVGGTWRLCMRGPSGVDEWQRFVFREIDEPSRLVFSYAFEDETGKAGHQSIVTVTFVEDAGKTRLTLHQAVFETVAVRDDHVRGWGEALDHLSAYVITAGARKGLENRSGARQPSED